MSTQNYRTQLLAAGRIDRSIHYGPYAINWWYFLNSKNDQNKQICFPIRINMRVRFELNKKAFIVRVVCNTEENNTMPGYVSETDLDSKIYSSASEVVNETYKKYFKGNACFSGPNVMGFNKEIMIEELQVGVSFFPFQIVTNNLKVLVTSIGDSDQEELNGFEKQSKIWKKGRRETNDKKNKILS